MAVRVSTGSRGSRNSQASRERHSLMTSPTRDETEPLLTSGDENEPGPTLAPSIQQREALLENAVSWWSLLRRRFSCRRACYSRTPRGKASILIFILNIIETLAFYGAVDGVLHLGVLPKSDRFSQSHTFFSLILQYTAGRLLYPITGILADAYFGRYKIVNGSLWLLWMAFAVLSVVFSLHTDNTLHVSSIATVHILPICTLVLISFGSAGFEANIIPFGVDQLSQGASSDEMSSYFYWYFAARQLGVLMGTSAFIGFSFVFRNHNDFNTVSAMQSMFIVLFLTVGILLNICFSSWYFKDRERTNPVKLILRVLFFAARAKRQPPRNRRAFRYGEGRKPKMELAKEEFDGIFPSDEVEDVKTFCRIVLVLVSLTGYYIAYFGVYVMVSQQVSTLLETVAANWSIHLDGRIRGIFSTVYTTFDSTAILLYLPVLNYLTRPFCPSVSMKARLRVGAAVNVLAAVACIIVRWATQKYLKTSPEHTLLWFMIPAALLAIAELYLFVTGLEFIYAQSPEHMKGLLTGLFYFIVGVCNAGAALLFSHIPLTSNFTSKRIDCILWYYMGCAITAFLGFVTYCVIAFLYTNRQRPTSNDDADLRLLYERQR